MLRPFRFISLAAVLVLSACGFHLKGNLPHTSLPVQIWSVQGGALQSHLETALRHNQATLNPNATNQISVAAYDTKKDIYRIAHSANLNEYLLSLRVIAQAQHNGKAWGKPIEVKVERVLPYSNSLILGKQYEEEQIWQEMHRDVAEQIVRQLAFLKDE